MRILHLLSISTILAAAGVSAHTDGAHHEMPALYRRAHHNAAHAHRRHHAANPNARRAASALPDGWSELGCYVDSVGARILDGPNYVDFDTLTHTSCASYCASNGYAYAGMEYMRECYCSNSLATGATLASDPNTCNMACSGAAAQTCGGANRLSVFVNPSAVPVVVPAYAGWWSQGCYTEGNGGRTLPHQVDVPGGAANMTVPNCLDACRSAGYTLAGAEYARECYCGNAWELGGKPAATGGCTMLCTGSKTQYCGGENRLNAYKWDPTWTTTVSTSLSTTATSTTSTSTSTSISTSTSTSASVSTTSSSTTSVASTSSSTSSSNSSTSTSTSASSSSSTASATSTTTSASSTSTPPAAFRDQWYSVGCRSEGSTGRTLPVSVEVAGGFNNMTLENCVDACKANGFTLAGAEYARECWCGNKWLLDGKSAVTADCNMACSGNSKQMCGGPDRLSAFEWGTWSSSLTSTTTASSTIVATGTISASTTTTSTAAATPSVPARYGDWSSLGCYTEGDTGRTLPVYMPVAGGVANNTISNCLDACQTNGYALAGVEWAQECFCGNEFQLNGKPSTDGGCDMVCKGNALQYCGGSNRLNAYKYVKGSGSSSSSSSSSSSMSTTVAATTTSSTASSTSSSVSSSTTTSTSTFVSTSTATSTSTTSTTSSIASTTSSSTTSSSTTTSATTSSATPTQTYPAVYQPTAQSLWENLGCYTDTPASRTLPVPVDVKGGVANNTVENCMSACVAAGYPLAGVQYSAECWCGKEFAATGKPTDSGCNMLCNGDKRFWCGGPDHLNAYRYSGTITTTTPANNGGGNTGTAQPVTQVAAPWQYLGCYEETVNARGLTLYRQDAGDLTIDKCIGFCNSKGYSIAGAEYGVQCFCDNYLRNGAKLAADPGDCSMSCGGDASQACGNGNRLSLYSMSSTLNELPVPSIKKTGLPGSYQYVGCIKEPDYPAPRVLPYKSTDVKAQSVESCLKLCSFYGFPVAALEYGEECWCGDEADIKNAVVAPEEDCSFTCPGSPLELCGAGLRMLTYKWTGEPIQTWNEPANKGRYQFLIGGPIVPLQTALGLNNKVTLLEKLGSGAQNTTHAYEFDYTLAPDYSKAFREMHVDTDIFCSAGVILPDKAGRQLNIGGWSLESTFGLRFYTPDGSPGKASKNDWEENWHKVSLQRGRWYPGAMMMSNGSVLVIGGEIGSNDYPEPTIEVLPKVPGGSTVLHMDWLAETDPLNLYPFAYVLPGGGIFVQYWNQARILDPVTFNTVKTLPVAPGAPNEAGGRTYPNEGTGMILPLHAPYTEPLTFLACGGSPGAGGKALDNCVSIQPEVEGAEWVLERMPFKRVMTCMTALPDGTFWIGNGAQIGAAGFGLATEPTLTALLYDPYQAVGKRFSILGKTDIPRMYHSESTLLHDGRVMVSGSDPLDDRFPEEYRIEVYLPPYLTDGRTQPTYTMTTTDWSYGGKYDVVVNLFHDTTATMRVSLLGAVVNSHGNSFGQRTLFPAFTCSGNRCTITAPPNSHIAPPGWFQLFVLDGPTPSHSQWVRIGGSVYPGIGEWPNISGFTVPGA